MLVGSTLLSFTNAFHSRRFSFEQLLAKVAELGIGPGLEVIGFQSIRGFPAVSDEFADRFRMLVDKYKLTPTSLAINADTMIRRGYKMNDEETANYLEPQIRAAARLGFPVVRSQFAASPEAIRRLVPLIEKLEVKLGPEVHAPLGPMSPPVLAYREMYAKLNSPSLGFVPDFGTSARSIPAGYIDILRQRGLDQATLDVALEIWRGPGDPWWKREEFNRRATELRVEPTVASSLSVMFSILSPNPPEAWLEIMPQVIHIHGKFYDFDAEGNETSIPYDKLLPVFVRGGYKGSMSSEWEGHIWSDDDGFTYVQQHHRLCRRILAGLEQTNVAA